MIKKLLPFLAGVFTITSSWSQQLSPTVIAADGGISRAAGITLEWTLGEISIESEFAGGRLYTEGFHQPILIAKTFYINTEQLLTGYLVSVAPNPVHSVLTTTISAPKDEQVFITLIDFTGKRFRSQAVSGKFSRTTVDMSGLIAGIYLLEVRNTAGQLIRSFKIIKGQ